jgi:uncharacterized protein
VNPVIAATVTAAPPKNDSTRSCLATGRTSERGRLVRFVVAPDGVLVPDVDEKLPGRGLWVTANRAAFETARRQKLFAKAARAPVCVADDLAQQVEALLLRRCREILGLAARAGQASFGYQKVRDWLIARKGGLLLEASDGAVGDCSKLRALASGLVVIDVLTAEELGAAMGRERLVHGVVAPGRLADSFAREALRLSGFRSERGTSANRP